MRYERILQTAMRAFESEVERLVEREVEFLCTLPGKVADVPIIGSMPFTNARCDPHAPPEELAPLKALAAQALRARKWFEFEGPRWGQPLPLRLEDCHQLLNVRSQRA